MDVRIPLLEIHIILESNLPKSRILVRRLAESARLLARVFRVPERDPSPACHTSVSPNTQNPLARTAPDAPRGSAAATRVDRGRRLWVCAHVDRHPDAGALVTRGLCVVCSQIILVRDAHL